ncbi:SMI1/KNR4 family protein [Bacillus velezensis]|uniref:SMI1/KNR4 family protein n=1 Tax=Bacillus amyloliquefaciens group TaxID=1938374 RepID=UPI0005B654DA|nr:MULTISPECIES: SMI1/KNR4 family protein [Bacillus amyloliquefaciens group]ATL40306.1 SMI1/KNR4 family protein [Bacillus velezensis]AWK46950.1 SMI1/KNR4 family protein [Bacillus velezensis]MCR4368175.1 SMI1/KNR4 family protein [Bacillus amyloliquefaciens]MCV3199724.1 SMI1/KNR4 family protein [Bacillus velezensis]MDP1503533.1 SMI1/KNR4 family protein [Bacillus velezensis]
MQSIKWRKRSTFQEATNSQIEEVEEKLKIKFPTDYREFIKDHNGCSPIDKKVVSFQNSRESINNLLSIGDPTRPIDLLSTLDNVKDRLVDKIIPFATDAGGNLFCFDYRMSSQEPVIVFWDHEIANEDKESSISYVCDSFTDLMDKLEEQH